MQTDRGVLLTRDEHQKVAEVADALQSFCVDEPVKCPLIFGGKDPSSSSHLRLTESQNMNFLITFGPLKVNGAPKAHPDLC